MKTPCLMPIVAVISVVLLSCLSGCNKASMPTPAPVAQVAIRNYSGTASVGDFLTISINSTALTIAYKDYTNGATGTVPYTVNANGTYAITDPTGNLVAAYEVPGSVLMVESNKSGMGQSTPALITAIESTPATINTFAGRNFNYIQFRTSSGGVELGTISIDAQGNIQHDGYWPFGALQTPPDLFNGGSFSAASIVEDPSGDFFTITAADAGGTSTAFGTENGFFAVDTGQGTILGLPKASSKSFSGNNVGTYTAIFYRKPNAQMGQNGETGIPAQGNALVTISAAGLMTITDSQGNTLATGTLAAIADTPYLYDGTPNTLSDPLYGMFTFRMTTPTSQQDVFVAFQGDAVIFSSFKSALPIQAYGTYTYFYGVGVS